MALDASSAALARCCDRSWRTYLNSKMNRSSILRGIVSWKDVFTSFSSVRVCLDLPLLGHHEDSLDQQAFQDLGTDSLK